MTTGIQRTTMSDRRPARDGETLSDEQVVEILDAAEQHASDWCDWATHAQCDRFLHSLWAVSRSHRNALATVAALRAEVGAKDRRIAELLAEDPACESCDEYEQLNGRLGDLLARTADALKGEPEPDSLHSWHDLPEIAAALRAQLADARVAIRELHAKGTEYSSALSFSTLHVIDAARAASGEDASHE